MPAIAGVVGVLAAGRADDSPVRPPLLDLFDAIAQARRFLEIQVFGRLQHEHPQFHDVEIVIGLLLALGGAAGGELLGEGLRVEGAHHATRRDAVLLVVGQLLGAAALGLTDRRLHRRGALVGEQDDGAVDVARGAADGLDEAHGRA